MSDCAPRRPAGADPNADPIDAVHLRVNRATRRALVDHLATSPFCRRFVFAASALARDPDMPEALTALGPCEIVLDPEAAEAAAPAFADRLAGKLPWAVGVAQPADATEERVVRDAVALAAFAAERPVDAVLAPSHLIDGGQGPRWLARDGAACVALREALDRAGLGRVAVDYMLVARVECLADPDRLAEIRRALAPLPFRHLWLRAGPFGLGHTHHAGVVIAAVAALGALGRPVVLDHAGGLVGLAPAVIGDASGLCHGVGAKLGFDPGHWPRGPAARTGPAGGRRGVYQPSLDRMASAVEQKALNRLPARGRTAFSCTGEGCCASDADVLEDRDGHFLRQAERLHRGYLAADRPIGRHRFRKRLWEDARQIKATIRSTEGNVLARRILEGSLGALDRLRQAVDGGGGSGADRQPLGFAGLAPSERGLVLRPTAVAKPTRRPPEPASHDDDLFEEFSDGP